MPHENTVESEAPKAVILLGHGSRVPGAAKPMERVAEELSHRLNNANVYVGFLSRLGPNYPEVFGRAVDNGAKEVVVIPYFLHEGLHILQDIPELMQEEAKSCPDVSVILGKSLGFDESLVGLVEKRLNESQSMDDVRDFELPRPGTYPVPPGQAEFVPVDPETAERLRSEGVVHHD